LIGLCLIPRVSLSSIAYPGLLKFDTFSVVNAYSDLVRFVYQGFSGVN